MKSSEGAVKGLNDLKERQKAAPLRALVPAFLPAVLAFVVFVPALGAGFVNWDDPAYVYQNSHIRSIDLRWAFTAVVASNYHPLTLLSHTLDYALFGLNPRGHHLTNIILHGLNSALVYVLGLCIFRKIMICKSVITGTGVAQGLPSAPRGVPCSALAAALASALLFAVHPLHVESVAWIAERKDVLSTFFFLLSVITYLGHRQDPRPWSYGLSLLLFALALLSKPMAITLPVVLLILDYYPLERRDRNWAGLVMEKAPFLGLSLCSAILTLWAQGRGGAVTRMHSYPLYARLFVAIRGYVFYSYKLLYPVTLAPYYPLPLRPGLADPAFLGSVLLIITTTGLCLYLARRSRRGLLAVWLYYLVTLTPVIGIIQVGSQAAADRYAYIPTIGYFLLIGFVVMRLCGRPGLKTPLAIVMFLVIALLGIKTWQTVPVWKDSLSLWRHEIEYLQSHGGEDRLAGVIAHYNLAKAYDEGNHLLRAADEYTRVLEINPRYLDAYVNRGVIYARLGQFRKAVQDFSQAIEIDHRATAAYYNRALAYGEMGEMELATKDMEAAQRLGWRRR